MLNLEIPIESFVVRTKCLFAFAKKQKKFAHENKVEKSTSARVFTLNLPIWARTLQNLSQI